MNMIKQKKSRLPKTLSPQWIVGNIFVVFCTIPWVHFGLNEMDSQPWSILLGLFFILLLSPSFVYNKFAFNLLWLTLFGIVLGLVFRESQFDFLLFRGVSNYIGFFVVLVAFMAFLKKYGFPLSVLVSMNLVWLLAGLLQVIEPGVLDSFVSGRTTIDRGLTSLAPEPTFFAIYLFFNSWLILIGTAYRPSVGIKFLIILNVLAILGLAMSTMGALFLAISGVFIGSFVFLRFSVSRRALLYGVVLFIALAVSYYVMVNYLYELRIARIINVVMHVPWIEVFKFDASINSRLANVVLPLHGFFYNYGMPGGFHGYEMVGQKLAQSYDGYFWYNASGEKILSWVGSFLYELGFIGLVSICFMAYYLFDGTRKRKFEIVLFFILLLSAIPLAFPLVPLMIATFYMTRKCLYRNSREKKLKAQHE